MTESLANGYSSGSLLDGLDGFQKSSHPRALDENTALEGLTRLFKALGDFLSNMTAPALFNHP